MKERDNADNYTAYAFNYMEVFIDELREQGKLSKGTKTLKFMTTY